jgi:hypothetical protein
LILDFSISIFSHIAVAIVGSFIAMESNADRSFAVIVLRDLKDVTVTVLVTGCLKELLSELCQGTLKDDSHKSEHGNYSDSPVLLDNRSGVNGQGGVHTNGNGTDTTHLNGNHQSRASSKRLDKGGPVLGVIPTQSTSNSGDRDGSHDDDDGLGRSYPSRTGRMDNQAIVAVIYGAHMLLETSPLASLDGKEGSLSY